MKSQEKHTRLEFAGYVLQINLYINKKEGNGEKHKKYVNYFLLS